MNPCVRFRKRNCYARFWTYSDRLHADETRRAGVSHTVTINRTKPGYFRWRISSKPAIVRFRTFNRERSRPSRVSVLSATRGYVGVCALQATRKPVTVLVVEDDWIIREDIVTDLRQEGWAVLEAGTGAGALSDWPTR
jgi:hypothetical protein